GTEALGYDALIVASGADPVRPPVRGLCHDRVFTVRSLDEAIRLRRLLDTGTIRRAIVVGAGYIGLETAEALVCAGADVEVIEALPRVLAPWTSRWPSSPRPSSPATRGCGSAPGWRPCSAGMAG